MPNDNHTQPSLVEMAIEPKSNYDQEKLHLALAKLTAEDPSFRVSIDHESGQTILKSVSEGDLEIKIDSLKRIYNVEVSVGAPQVAFRERVTMRAEHSFTYKKQAGGTGQFAAVTLVVEPNRLGEGYKFESRSVGRT